MLRLTQIELLGFKSFAHKTVLDLDERVNCVVGPNGSGKSNIADAILFAFGGQSSRELRTSNMAGLIFAGTEDLRPLNLASVTLHFQVQAPRPGRERELAEEEALDGLSMRAQEMLEEADVTAASADPESEQGQALTSGPGALPGTRLTRHVPVAPPQMKDPTPAVMKQLEQVQPGDQISVTRRVFRDGSGGYFINGEAVRLKDVDAFFDRYNLGRSAAFSVNQGEVERKILAGPQELREWLAEATGVALLLQQKDRAQGKLKRAQQNLTRLRDILSHTESLVADLAQQRVKAEQHLKLAAQLRAVELNEIRREIEFAQKQLENAGKSLGDVDQALEEARRAFEALQGQAHEGHSELRRLEEQINQAAMQQAQQQAEVERLRREAAVAARSAEAATAALSQLDKDRVELSASLQGLDEENSKVNAALAAAREEHRLAGAQSAQRAEAFNAAKAGVEAISAQQAQVGRSLFELGQTIARLNNEAEAIRRHGQQLEGQLEARQRYSEAVAERLAQQQAELEAETARSAALEDETAALRSALNQHNQSLLELAAELKAGEAECAGLRAALAELRARRQAVAEMHSEAERDSGRAALLEHGELAAQLHSVTEVTFAPELRPAFTRLLAQLSHGLAGAGSLRSAALEHLKARQSEALLLSAAAASEPHPLSLWRQLSGAPEVLAGLRAALGEVALANDLAEAEALLEREPRLALAVLADGSALLGRGMAWLGAPAPERARDVSRLSDLAELDRQISAAAGELEAAEQALASAHTAHSARQLERDEVSSRLASAAERQRASAELATRMAGAVKDRQAELSLLQHQNQELQLEREKLSGSLPEIEKQLTDSQGRLAQLSAERDALETQRDGALARLEQAREEQTELLTAIQLAQQKLRHLEQQSLDLAERHNNARRRLEGLSERQQNLEREREAAQKLGEHAAEQSAALEESISALGARLGSLKQQREEKASGMDAQQEEITRCAQAVARLEQDQQALAATRERAAERLQEWLLDLRERFNLSLAQLLSDPAIVAAPPDAELDAAEAGRGKLREEKARLREALDAIGTVNLLSIEQHKLQSERLEFLSGQASEVEKAAADLLQLVADLDRGTERRYTRQIDRIQERFDKLVKHLFGGGWGRLRFIPPATASAPAAAAGAAGAAAGDGAAAEGENFDVLPEAPAEQIASAGILACGVEVEVQLPGARRHALRGLSGGQRSMIFLALFFAVHGIRSPGFCLLDEADAALDDANVGRFAKLLESYAQEGETPAEQVIVVTHNKRTMEIADKLIGVVGRPKGVSNLLAVDLKDAKKLADKTVA
ncbi:AAA family ATPase [bacterium]|nr:AAA family ATPase [bacterium]